MDLRHLYENNLVARRFLKHLGFHEVDQIYQKIKHIKPIQASIDALINLMGLKIEYDESLLKQVPSQGPIIVVCNHPFGALEGLVLSHMLYRQRSDIKVLANSVLSYFTAFNDLFIYIEPYSRTKAYKYNIKGTKLAISWLKNGGALIVFPSGEVAHSRLFDPRVKDSPWNNGVLSLIEHSKCAVLPMFIHGQNGILFQCLGMIHENLRTIWLARELLNKRYNTIKVQIGSLLSYENMKKKHFSLDHLRSRCELLSHRALLKPLSPIKRNNLDVLPFISKEKLCEQIDIVRNQKIYSFKNYDVFVVSFDQSRVLIDEIAKLRETTFRLAMEGTGHEKDLDEFDRHYLHLFVFDQKETAIVGAYRLGVVDQILKLHGMKGLYTNTLFSMHKSFFKMYPNCIEMGRSFVTPAYQKNIYSLMLLFKGIGAFLVRQPQYKMLFGPVSISQAYSMASQKLLAQKLLEMHPLKTGLIHPRKPFAIGNGIRKEMFNWIKDENDLEDAIMDLEKGQRAMPILIKHYIRLGAKFCNFNVDEKFGNCVDGFTVVDLKQTSPNILKNYMGDEGFELFTSHD